MSAAIVAAGVAAAGTAYAANQQSKARKAAANMGSAQGDAQQAGQQSREDIQWVNDLNRQNATWTQQQNQASVDNALTQNRVDQTSDFGSVDWTKDPTTGAWSQKSSIAPELQGPLSQLRGQYGDMIGGLSSDQFGVNNDVMKAQQALSAPMLEQQRNRENARLAAMGLSTGSGSAWGTAQDALNRSEGEQFNRDVLAANQAWLAGQGNLRSNLGAMSGLETAWRQNSQQPTFAQSAAPQMSMPTVGQPQNMTWEAAKMDREQGQQNAVNQANAGAGWGNVAGTVAGAIPQAYQAGRNAGWWGGSGNTGGSNFQPDTSAFGKNYGYGDVM